MQTVAFPMLDEIVRCDKAHLRGVLAWKEPYCISSSREQPVDVAVSDPEVYEKFCCSEGFEECPFYRPSILIMVMKGSKIDPPEDA